VQQTANGGFTAVLRMFGFNIGSGLGTFPASDNPGLLPSLNINTGQFSPGALAAGVQASPAAPNLTDSGIISGGYTPVPDATGIFPTIEPGGTSANSVITNGLPPSRNLG
jgi:hypothetical protein